MEKLKAMQSMGRVSAGFSMVMALPLLFYTIYSGMMWNQLRKNEAVCSAEYYNDVVRQLTSAASG